MKNQNMSIAGRPSRRDLLRLAGAAAPLVVPSYFFGQNAPSNRIRLGQIGCGRIARGSELRGLLRHHELARFVAVCDLDTVRLADGKQFVEEAYTKSVGAGKFEPVKTYGDYREMLKDKGIDAVCISTPDHWHAQPAMEAAIAGKDIYLQKPASLTIAEGRQMADTIKRTGRILQMGSQQRSDLQFRLACELIRNGRIGKIQQIFIGLPVDPSGDEQPEMPTPKNLNYDMWLGCTPWAYYTEQRVHPQTPDISKRYDRPGWLRCEQFGAGMITGWGSHHLDIAQWAMGLEHSGPVEVEASAEFPKKGLWDVHGPFHVRARYANGAEMFVSDMYPNGLRFIGEDGWIWVTRGSYKAGQPVSGGPRNAAFDASNPAILREGIRSGEIHLHASPENDHHLDWLVSVRNRTQPAAPAEDGHRACSACLISHIAMKLRRPLKWDPQKERFINDPAADAMLQRPQRSPYGTNSVKG